MNVNGKPTRTIWPSADGRWVNIIDQTLLPHHFLVSRLLDVEAAAYAIRTMEVRGAPLIGATAAYGIALAMRDDPSSLEAAYQLLHATRPTAVNLRWALDRVRAAICDLPLNRRASAAWTEAGAICEEDVAINHAIGEWGLTLIRAAADRAEGRPVNILTHCNAGWLGTVDWGTALAPIYLAHREGIAVHVWVDETRPRNQGASLTAWELGQEGIAHTLIVDNAGGHLMQHGLVDMCIVGTDRVTASGDVCNKIGTYLKALAAHDNGVPFYVALPASTVDWRIRDGIAEVPIEERAAEEVTHVTGMDAKGTLRSVRIAPEGCAAKNYAFDVTPARLVTALITERGICGASAGELARLFPDLSAKGAA